MTDSQTSPSPQEWEDKRAYLNHDVLCNQVRNELTTIRTNPDGIKPLRLSMLLQREEEYRALLRTAPTALSSANLLYSPLFSCWSTERKESMRPAFHALFLLSSEIERKIAGLDLLLTEAMTQIRAFLETPLEQRDKKIVEALQEKLARLSVGLSGLTEAQTQPAEPKGGNINE